MHLGHDSFDFLCVGREGQEGKVGPPMLPPRAALGPAAMYCGPQEKGPFSNHVSLWSL